MGDIEIKGPIRVDRPLTDEERALTRWILENGVPEAVGFLDQLERACVVGLCPCGCATIDFAINGLPEAPPGVRILGDFVFGDETDLAGVFVFESNGILRGLEVYGLAGDAPKVLPKPKELRPFGNSAGR
jgi:hypothetical protein